jgi:hypothetical protein
MRDIHVNDCDSENCNETEEREKEERRNVMRWGWKDRGCWKINANIQSSEVFE